MPKLPRNMIRRKDRGGYWFRTEVGGKARQMSLGSDYQEACRKLRELQRSDVLPSRVSVDDAAKQWMGSYVQTVRNPTFQTLTRRRVEQYLSSFLGLHLMGRLTGEHVRAYRLWLEGKGIQPQTVKHVLSDLRCLLRWAEDTGLIGKSPFPRKVMPKIQERPPDRLSITEIETVCALPDPWGFVCRLAVNTGLRWGELTRLQSFDVNGDVILVHQTKSGKVRRIPISPQLKGELRTKIGKLVPYTQASRGSFNAMVKKLSGIDGFHVHQLRHSFACIWLERGGSLASLQQLLGHSSVVTTQRYARLSDEAVQEEARKLMGGRS